MIHLYFTVIIVSNYPVPAGITKLTTTFNFP